MKFTKLDFFGDIDLKSDEIYYEAKTKIAGRTVELDLNLNDDVKSDLWISLYRDYVKNIETHYKNVRDYIYSHIGENDSIKDYIDFHLDELSDYQELQDAADSEEPDKAVFALIKLMRVGFYMEDPHYVVWDFSFGKSMTDELLVVFTDLEGSIESIAWES